MKPEFQELENAAAPSPQPAVPPPPEKEKEKEPQPGGETLDADFADLVRLLATNAYAAMGLLSDPGRKLPVDLEGARRMIDWLSLIERKTRNNLSFAEQNFLTRVLYELRMAFVEATAPAGPAAR